MERTPGGSSSPYVRAENRQILFRGKLYANLSCMAQHRLAVPSTHMCIWFANIRRARVYEALHMMKTMMMMMMMIENMITFSVILLLYLLLLL